MRRRMSTVVASAFVACLIAGCTVKLIEPTGVPGALMPVDIVADAMAPLGGPMVDDAAVAASLTYYADDAVASVLGNPAGEFTFPSKADIAGEYTSLARDDHMRMQVLGLEATGNTVTGVVNIFGDKAAYYGVNPLVLDGKWVIEDGLIAAQTFTFTPDSAAQLQEAMMAEQVVLAFAKQTANPLTPENLEATLDFYAEDAVLHTPGAPNGQQEHAGKSAIRAFLAHDAEYNTVNQITVVAVDGNTVTARNVSWADWMADPANDAGDMTEVFVIKDGHIQSDYFLPKPDWVVDAVDFLMAENIDMRPDPADVEVTTVAAMVAPWVGEAVTTDAVDESLRWYADDATFTILGLPEGVEVYKGKDALRGIMESWVAMHQRWEVEPLMNYRGVLTTRTLTWLDPTVAMGIAPVEATEVYVLKDGLIQSETWMISPESLEALVAAMAAARP